ncbi:shikimate kinase [bacterium]|nr:shikimate kinase [bacterium]
MKNNIILIGMMGAGKSTVGIELAKILTDFKLVDIDSEIEKNTNMKISEIFSNFDEEYFRNLETEFLQEICQKENQIIATGGGIFEKEQNRKILKENGKVFYLKASAETLFDRIKKQTHRPLLKQGFGVDNVKNILDKREANYSKAHIIVDTENKPLYNIVKEIAEKGNSNEQRYPS